NVEHLRSLGEADDVVLECLPIDGLHAERHLRLLIDEEDLRVLRGENFELRIGHRDLPSWRPTDLGRGTGVCVLRRLPNTPRSGRVRCATPQKDHRLDAQPLGSTSRDASMPIDRRCSLDCTDRHAGFTSPNALASRRAACACPNNSTEALNAL